jgi:transposase
VLGVDDWAWRRGRTYGTLLCDLERGRIVDLLPGRDVETLAPSAYAPAAIQVADRFHLVCNLTAAVQRILEREAGALRAAQRERASTEEAQRAAARPERVEHREQLKRDRRAVRLARYEEVVALWRDGRTVSEIVAGTGLSRGTLERWLKAGSFPERAPHPPRRCGLDPHREFLQQRWDAGCHNATALWRELQARGVRSGLGVGLSQVRWYVRARLRRRLGAIRRAADEPYTAPATRLSSHRVAWLLTQPDERLAEADRQVVARVCAESPVLAGTRTIATEFVRVLREHDVAAFEAWQHTAATSPLVRFARTLDRDATAVRNAVALSWSNGATEGHVNRLKLVKRSMYGRASIALLRRRVIAA